MSTIRSAEDILQALADAKVPKGVIAKKLVIAPSAVTDLYAGRRQLKHDEALRLLDLVPDRTAGAEIPLIGLAGAGNWIEAIEETKERIWVPREAHAVGRFAVEVVGQSMNLVLPEGTLAVINPEDRDLFVGKMYLLRNSEGEATIKRYRADPARFEPVSDDPTFEAFSVGSSDFRVIGRVTYAMQRF
jgi:SOS-response transcriptional repressor LexA